MADEHKLQMQQERQFSSGILSVTTTFRLLVTGDTGLKEIERLIRILMVQKQIMEESETDGALDAAIDDTIQRCPKTLERLSDDDR